MLYPLKFKPRFKQRAWGGSRLKELFGKKLPENKFIGESWEISTIDGDESVVAEGVLKGNNLSELIEVYMGDLVGEAIYEKYGLEFPLLIKLLDASDNLSVQVHPDDALALARHNCMGKTEMWYVMEAEPGARLGIGLKKGVTKEQYDKAVAEGTTEQILNSIEVNKGDVFFLPAGTVHYIGRGIVIAEIQQTSDITYRIYDWNRNFTGASRRELHTDLAREAINFDTPLSKICVTKAPIENTPVTLVRCEHFTTQLLGVNGDMLRDFGTLDSFVVYMCMEGSAKIADTTISRGDTILLPAQTERLTISGQATLLEIFMM